MNLFTNDYGVWTEKRASYLWRINARNVQHPTELSFEHADRNASNNSCQLEMWERVSILSLNCVHFILVIWFHSHKPFGHLFETRAQQLIRFFLRKKMLCGFLCGDGNFTQLSFSYDQWLFFVAIVFSCWKKSWFAFFLFSLALMKNIDKMTESTSCCMMVLVPKRERKHWCKNKCFSKVYAISNGILINSYCSNLLWAICVCSTVFKLICQTHLQISQKCVLLLSCFPWEKPAADEQYYRQL